MNTQLRRIGGSLILGSLLELMLFFPIVLGAYVLKPPGTTELALVCLLLLAVYWIGYGLNAWFKFVHPFPKILLSLILAAACGIPLLGVTAGSIVLMAIAVFFVYRGSKLPGLPLGARLTSQDFIVGVFLYFVGSLVDAVNGTFDGYRALYLLAGMAALFISLYLTNRNMVGRETLSGAASPTVEPSVRRNNRIFVGIAIGVAVLISLAFQQQHLIGQAWHAFADWLTGLFSGGGGQQEPPPAQDMTPPTSMLPPAEESKKLPAWANYIMYGIVALFALVILFLIGRRLNRLPGWLDELRRKFAGLFQRDHAATARGYVDEVERIKKTERSLRQRFGRSKEDRLKWKDLTDNETRIRYLYRRWVGNAVKKGFPHQPHLTPREIQAELSAKGLETVPGAASDALLQQYQQVRYAGGKLSDEQVQALAVKLGQIKP
ncbi:DUF4129 domain-containing protein [Paenibacillus sacheonensis]|uniref:DUF4129 domain-containing protein n=1 Tax=Paenibacillus sacheonensis TaxID=742054 RepID=A0A7X5BV80_9BACL|nr:DUF4129 domain-containing protein [Paenibacillus sacheonensis]MBM7563309.1 hypothetical protein [Paenibacillus sacheonensis]NBC68133.1 DUF4129 domain-containing protein [Paenibacillus sacheonensis]